MRGGSTRLLRALGSQKAGATFIGSVSSFRSPREHLGDMLRVLKRFQHLRCYSAAALPAPDTNPPILYTGVSANCEGLGKGDWNRSIERRRVSLHLYRGCFPARILTARCEILPGWTQWSFQLWILRGAGGLERKKGNYHVADENIRENGIEYIFEISIFGSLLAKLSEIFFYISRKRLHLF